MGNKWALYNTVWFDGCDAWVSKFILPSQKTEKELINEIEKCGYDGSVLLIEKCYDLTLENIIAMSEEETYKCVIDRFSNMFF